MVYCSAKCQREDWRFHKRNCKPTKSIAQDIPKDGTENVSADQKITTSKKKCGSEIVVDEDEKIVWYRHREWKPEIRQDVSQFVPTKIDSPQPDKPRANPTKSAWNAADSWEERDVTQSAREWLQREVKRIKNIEGFASITNVRGRVRYIFDFSFDIEGINQERLIRVTDFSSSSDLEIRPFDENLQNKFEDYKNNLVEYLSSI
jgi:hypothetical protein